MITFELKKGQEALEIHGDVRGLEKLSGYINELIESELQKGECEDILLMTPDWGGEELSGRRVGENNDLIKSVKIFRWTEEFTKEEDNIQP